MLHLSALQKLREDMVGAGLWDARQEEAWQDTEARAKERRQLKGPPDAQWVATLEIRADGLAAVGELQKAQRLFEEAGALRRKTDGLAAVKEALFAAEEKSRVKAALLTRRVITDRSRAYGQRIDKSCREHFGPSARFAGPLPAEIFTLYEEGLRMDALLQTHGIILQVPEEPGNRQVDLGIIWHVSREFRAAVCAKLGIRILKAAAV